MRYGNGAVQLGEKYANVRRVVPQHCGLQTLAGIAQGLQDALDAYDVNAGDVEALRDETRNVVVGGHGINVRTPPFPLYGALLARMHLNASDAATRA